MLIFRLICSYSTSSLYIVIYSVHFHSILYYLHPGLFLLFNYFNTVRIGSSKSDIFFLFFLCFHFLNSIIAVMKVLICIQAIWSFLSVVYRLPLLLLVFVTCFKISFPSKITTGDQIIQNGLLISVCRRRALM